MPSGYTHLWQPFYNILIVALEIIGWNQGYHSAISKNDKSGMMITVFAI